MAPITDIEGIGDSYADKLRDVGVDTVEDLLQQAGSPDGRGDLAEKTGISPKLILTWTNHADLFRVKGVAGQYAELLEVAGVDSVPELAQRNAASLTAKMAEVNEGRNLVRVLPAESDVADWIRQAKDLPRAVTH